VKQKAHFIQDAMELYAVARLQQLAENNGVAGAADATKKMAAFRDYAEARDLNSDDFENGEYGQYMSNLERALPNFISRLNDQYQGRPIDFIDVEAKYRNLGLKGDFLVVLDRGREQHSVSLKNYRKSASRPQVSSGTFNSFIVNFLFDSQGVGSWLDPTMGTKFRSGAGRDEAFIRNGYGHLLPAVRELDALNLQIKERFVLSDEFEFLDEAIFDHARKEIGLMGASICAEILQLLPRELVARRLLKMTGLDGAEHFLIIDSVRDIDTLTSKRLQQLLVGCQRAPVHFDLVKQGLRFAWVEGDESLLTVDVPFTINKNGAWVSDEPYPGTRPYRGEPYPLAFNQRRPRKSRELATSINTYVNFEASGVFES